ncbi:hypothetical protein MKX03_033314 [Papaver bracteatum]|nr:hypothetical protein MKX03_033314 [Papaver bracteatum]
MDRNLRKTFVLAYPSYLIYRDIGNFVAELEKLSLKITEMRCMNVSEDFARKHLVKIGLIAAERLAPEIWIQYITYGPVVAMIVEGDKNSVKQYIELVSKQQLLVSKQQPQFSR